MKVIAETKRLKIRGWTQEDAEEFLRLSQDPGFNQFSITKYKQSSLVEAKSWLERAVSYFQKHGIGLWAVIRKEDESLIGICGLRYYPDPEIKGDVEVTYRFAESVWGKGYGTEATCSCMEYGFTRLGLSEIIAVIDPKNEPSKKIIQKLGMISQGSELYRGEILVERYSRRNENARISMRPDFIKHCSEIQKPDDSHYPDNDELLSIASPFGKEFGFKRLGIHHEVLKPGRRTSWPHAHSADEEFVYVLEGTPEVWIDGETYPLRSGDGVGFPPGTGICHTVINNSNSDVHLIVVGDMRRDDDLGFYPLNPSGNKMLEKRGRLWQSPPRRPLGTHDGLPDALRKNSIDPQEN